MALLLDFYLIPRLEGNNRLFDARLSARFTAEMLGLSLDSYRIHTHYLHAVTAFYFFSHGGLGCRRFHEKYVLAPGRENGRPFAEPRLFQNGFDAHTRSDFHRHNFHQLGFGSRLHDFLFFDSGFLEKRFIGLKLFFVLADEFQNGFLFEKDFFVIQGIGNIHRIGREDFEFGNVPGGQLHIPVILGRDDDDARRSLEKFFENRRGGLSLGIFELQRIDYFEIVFFQFPRKQGKKGGLLHFFADFLV